MRLILAVSFLAVVAAPAEARVYKIAGPDAPQQIGFVDCAESPQGRNGTWVAANCKNVPAAQAGDAAKDRPMMIIGWNHEVMAPRDAN